MMVLMSCDSVCCMCGKACSSRILMTQWPMANTLACLSSCKWWTFWAYLVTINLFSLYLMNFVSHHAWCSGYKSTKCDVSFSQGSVSTLLKWGKHVFHACAKCSFCLEQCKKLWKSCEFFENYDHQCRPTVMFYYESQCSIQTTSPILSNTMPSWTWTASDKLATG